MATEPKAASRRWLWRIALLVLVVLPLLPEIVVLSASAIATLSGCRVDAPPPVPPDPWMVANGFAPAPGPAFGNVCVIGPLPPLSNIIRRALEAGLLVGVNFGSGLVLIWLPLCYLSISRGFAGLLTRLTLALLVSLIFAVAPYFGPMMSMEHFENPNCQPNEAGAGPCILYGDDVGNVVNDNVALGWRVFIAAPMAFGALFLYAMFLLVGAFVSRRAMGRAA